MILLSPRVNKSLSFSERTKTFTHVIFSFLTSIIVQRQFIYFIMRYVYDFLNIFIKDKQNLFSDLLFLFIFYHYLNEKYFFKNTKFVYAFSNFSNNSEKGGYF